MSQKHVFIVVTAGNCGYCTRFKTETWPTLKPKLVNSGRLNVVEIQLETMSEVHTDSFINLYPEDLRRYIVWFPTFILCTYSSWIKRDFIDAVVMNGQMIFNESIGKEVATLNSEQIDANEENILQWLTQHLKSNKFVGTNSGSGGQNSSGGTKIVLTDRRSNQTHSVKQPKKMKFKIQTV